LRNTLAPIRKTDQADQRDRVGGSYKPTPPPLQYGYGLAL